MKKKSMFSLDRDGGREKISQAMYSPQAHRRENAACGTGGRWNGFLAVMFGIALGYALFRYL